MNLPIIPVDLIVNVYNEPVELPLFLESLSAQVLLTGEPLPPGALRVLVVEQGDGSNAGKAIALAQDQSPNVEFLHIRDSHKGLALGRRYGALVALQADALERRPLLATADVDTRHHPHWVATIMSCLGSGAADAMTAAGHYSAEFWEKAHKLRMRYYDEIGTIFFGLPIIQRFQYDERACRFSGQIFHDLMRMPSDCAFAMRKAVLAKIGNYRQEFWPEGREIIGEGWNLTIRLRQIGARFAYCSSAPYETSARRLLLEADRMLGGHSYNGVMTDLREAIEPWHYNRVNELAATVDFEPTRRYVIRYYILLASILWPERLHRHPEYFGGVAAVIAERIKAARTLWQVDHGVSYIYQLAEDLEYEFFDVIDSTAAERCAKHRGAS